MDYTAQMQRFDRALNCGFALQIDGWSILDHMITVNGGTRRSVVFLHDGEIVPHIALTAEMRATVPAEIIDLFNQRRRDAGYYTI